MIVHSSLLLPTDKPISSIAVKRAMLTYDTVYIPSPDDRDLIPPNSYFWAVLGLPILGLPIGFRPGGTSIEDNSVRALGKRPSYDLEFQKFMDIVRPAEQAGAVNVLTSPKYDNRLTIGAVPVPEGTPSP